MPNLSRSSGSVEEDLKLRVGMRTTQDRQAMAWLITDIDWAEEQWRVAIKTRSSGIIHARYGLCVRLKLLEICRATLDTEEKERKGND